MTVFELRAALAPVGVALDDTALNKLCAYADLLAEQNRVQNLIGPATENDVANRHFVDSLAPLRALADTKCSTWNIAVGSLVDVGSGAGFPGLVLAIALPELRVTLCDSLGKRCDFLSSAARTLDLPNVEVLNARAEEMSRTARRESFDFATARAVTSMSALCELCLPLLRVGGRFFAYKTARASDEISSAANAMRMLGGKAGSCYDYTLGEAAMRLVSVDKRSPTPASYPRPWGKIKSKPL